MKTYKLDGTTLEGGGQLVRLSTCLAALTGKNLHLYSIRGRRSGNRGLKGQHLSAVRWLAAACDADVEGMSLGSQEVVFRPGRTRNSGVWKPETLIYEGEKLDVIATRIDLSTPGAVTLNLQALLPFLLLGGCELAPPAADVNLAKKAQALNLTSHSSSSPQEGQQPTPLLLTLTGGTNVSNSPSIDYIAHVLLPNLQTLGLPSVTVLRKTTDPRWRLKRGWSSPGGGRGGNELGSVSLLVRPISKGQTLPALNIPARGNVRKVSISLLASGDVLQHLRAYAVSELHTRFNAEKGAGAFFDGKTAGKGGEVDDGEGGVEIEECSAEDSGEKNRLHVLLVAYTDSGLRLGADCLCEEKIGKTVSARTEVTERLVRRAVDVLLREIRSCQSVDRWMEDQLVVFRALAEGRSRTVRPVEDNAGDEVGENAESEGGATLHTRTVRWVANELLGVEFDEQGDCEGVGYVAGVGLSEV